MQILCIWIVIQPYIKTLVMTIKIDVVMDPFVREKITYANLS